MTKIQAIGYFGSGYRLAAALGIKPHTISEWIEVPPIHQVRLEAMTGGILRADDAAWSPAEPRFTKAESRVAARNLEIFKAKS